jgi:hypothetical protein
VLAGVDVRAAATLHHVVQVGRRDDPQRLVEGRKAPATLGRLRLSHSALRLEWGALTVGPQRGAEDLRGVIRRRLRLTREREPSPGDQRGAEGDAAFQEPAAARVLPGGFGEFGVGSWIAHRHLLGPLGRVSDRGRYPLSQGVGEILHSHAGIVKATGVTQPW